MNADEQFLMAEHNRLAGELTAVDKALYQLKRGQPGNVRVEFNNNTIWDSNLLHTAPPDVIAPQIVIPLITKIE